MSKPIESVVIVQYDEHGEQSFYISGDERTRLFIVDERAKNDRVYEWLSRDDAGKIREVLGEGPFGSSKDERHAAIEHKVRALMDGKPHLTVVETSEG